MPRRKKNVRGAFCAHRHGDLPGARLLVVDDIMTSGATLHEVARMLRKAGASQVMIAVLARAPGVD
jgi:predicted amidophosphoribosyltransferase